MNILNKILKNKYQEINKYKNYISIYKLEKSKFFKKKCYSLTNNLLNNNIIGIISEFKRNSPSMKINVKQNTINIVKILNEYELAGSNGISILTDEKYFGADYNDLIIARNNTKLPILKKDFILDEYQIISAKSMGADAVLLIANILSKKKLYSLAYQAYNLGLEVIMEIHDIYDIDKINDYINILGINNRNLKTFQIDINASINIYNHLPKNFLKISESGISNINDIILLHKIGFKGFLIGEMFMKNDNPGKTCKKFIKKINQIFDKKNDK